MTTQIDQIIEEIEALKDADIKMLDALANNAIYVLSKLQQTPDADLSTAARKQIDTVISDMLNTVNKELEWAKEEEFNDEDEFLTWFSKAKQQVLNDLGRLYDDEL